jgi:predicted transcriptional regulator
MTHSILTMAKDLVLVQITACRLSPDAVQQALATTHAHLLRLRHQEHRHDPPLPSPPIDWRRSITHQTVTCLACGLHDKQLSWRHLRTHGLDGRTYRATYGIPRTQALTARCLTARRQQIARRVRPWEQAPQNRTPPRQATTGHPER